MDTNVIITFLACVIVLVIFGKILVLPLKTMLKIIFNSVLGAALIYIINLIGASFSFHIGLNIITAIVIGILGLPGAVLLVFLKIIIG
ncbi:MAG: pro-sigmaK processing inhibitor BofA family protein [Lachnospiraceae bacterium]|jgi:inhibitor of the pro-sigma K processing machinery|nr:pro-sigmaK processing inhibitor BofA family protein [Lachnospiraceae bacterium]